MLDYPKGNADPSLILALGPHNDGDMPTIFPLAKNVGATAFAFRGYDLANLGRTPELLIHPKYGPTVDGLLREASEVTSEVLRRRVDLVARVRRAEETTGLATYAEDV